MRPFVFAIIALCGLCGAVPAQAHKPSDSYLTLSAAQTTNLTNEEIAVITQLDLMQASVALVLATGGGWEASDLP